jgi:serine protease Do
VGSTQVGESVQVGILRDGKRMNLKVRVGELPDDALASAAPVEETKSSALGLTVEDLDDEVRTTLDIDHGVWVSQVEDDSPADQAGVRQGDVIMMLGGKQVKDVAGFNTLIEELPTGKSVPLLVQRGQGPVFLALKVAE